MKLIKNCTEKYQSSDGVNPFTVNEARKALKFHQSIPEYQETPLYVLNELAKQSGIKKLWIKDESVRFNLNAFKVLGGSYCLGNYITRQILHQKDDILPFQTLKEKASQGIIPKITFVTATDGNHGRGIAWAANCLGHNCVVYMPAGSSQERLENIRKTGAEASITRLNYDDTVRWAREQATKNGWVLVQDTSWTGYEEIPEWIMKGYTTMGIELTTQLRDEIPTHIFLQAGVGAMAGAMTGFFQDYYKKKTPIITIVESEIADCILETAFANDRTLHKIDGNLNTIMAGLACGEPCHVGWNILSRYADYFAAVPDWIAAKGMRVLACPLNGDHRIISGESGAAPLGFVVEILQNKKMKALREYLRIDQNSKILCISSEGATDAENYKHIVWDGIYNTPGCI